MGTLKFVRHVCETAAHPDRPLDELNAGQQVKTEVNEVPLDALPLVFLLLQDEHGVVEELLQTLIGVVDAELLEGVVLRQIHVAEIKSVIKKQKNY